MNFSEDLFAEVVGINSPSWHSIVNMHMLGSSERLDSTGFLLDDNVVPI